MRVSGSWTCRILASSGSSLPSSGTPGRCGRTGACAWREKKLRGLFVTGAGASGNAATRIEAFIHSKGAYAYGGYPDIDALYQQQAVERDRAKREALLHRIQQLTVERVMFAPIFNFRGLHGVGPRVAEHTLKTIPMHPFPSYEDVRLKGQ